jgi:hypothetical protein
MTDLQKLKDLWLYDPNTAIQLTTSVPEFQYSDFDVNLVMKPNSLDKPFRALVQSKSGLFEFSIIGGKHYYCTPRVNGGPFTEIELGIFCTKTNTWAFPSQILHLLREHNLPEGEYSYQVDENNVPTDKNFGNAIFAYIPIVQVIEMLVKL